MGGGSWSQSPHRYQGMAVMLLGAAASTYFVSWTFPGSSFVPSTLPFWIERTICSFWLRSLFASPLARASSDQSPPPQTLVDCHMHSSHPKPFSTWPSMTVPYLPLLLLCLLFSTFSMLFFVVTPNSMFCSLSGSIPLVHLVNPYHVFKILLRCHHLFSVKGFRNVSWIWW